MIPHSKPYITDSEADEVRKTLLSNNIASGSKVKEFEQAIASYTNSHSAYCTSSGSSALYAALKAIDLNSGDEVILPTYVCSNVMDAVKLAGAVPVLCDTGSEWNMTAGSISQKITKKTKAIIAVHIYGIPADVTAIIKLGYQVIEDCCQSIGASTDGARTGSMADISMYSFHATKLLTTGEGGAVTAKDPAMADRVRKVFESNTIFFPMSNIQASLGAAQIAKYNVMLEMRKKIADRYFGEIRSSRAKLPLSVRNSSIFFRFPLTIDNMDFDDLQSKFAERGIAVRRGVDNLLHRMEGLSDKDFPNAVRSFNSTLCIPIYPALKEDEQDRIITAVNKILS